MSSASQIRSLGLENLIKEAVTLALYEQDQAPQMAPPPAPNAGAVPPPPPAGPEAQNQPPQPPPGSPDQAQQPPMTIDSMIERLNVIRGGKSFTDPEVYGQVVTYFKKITPEQNQIIDQFLADVSRIMVNVRTGTQEPVSDQTGQPGAPPAPGGSPQAPISPSAGAVSPAGAGAGATPPGV